MRRSTCLALLAVLAAVLSGLAIAETTARWLRPQATREALLAQIDRHRHAWRRPDADFHHVGDGGFRLEFPKSGAQPETRLLIVGDSFAMGHGVEREKRFGALLAHELGEAAAVDVLATTTYSPVIYRNLVRRAVAANPYVCLAVFVDQSDPGDDVIYRKDLRGPASHEFDLERMRDRDAELRATLGHMADRLAGWRGVPRRSALFNLAFPFPGLLAFYPAASPHRDYVELSLARTQIVRVFDDAPDSELAQTMRAVLLGHLDEIVDVARAAGAFVILAANPWEDQVSATPRIPRVATRYPRENHLERLLRDRYAAEPGVAVVELTGAFRSAPDPSSLFLPADVHWNDAGHALVARVLLEELRRHGPGAPRDGTEAFARLAP